MNYLVFLDPSAGELEKILSGTKSAILKEFDPAQAVDQPVSPGDSLYFLRSPADHILRVTASVVHVLTVLNTENEELSRTLKEMQPRLQLTEDQYNFWSSQQQVLLVEFDRAQKIDMLQVAAHKTTNLHSWIAFEAFSQITQEKEELTT